MNDMSYEEYMKNVLGYQNPSLPSTYDVDYGNTYNITTISNVQNQELEKCYPDIYKLVYPMVKKACLQNSRILTKELIDEITDDIYFSIEDDQIEENRESKDSKENSNIKETDKKEDRHRKIRNPILNDLIKILLLREVIGRPGHYGRPPFPRPPRPPMGPRPPRPPMRYGDEQLSNFYNGENDLYEY